MVSTLPYHDAGADAADELAVALSTGARYLDALLDAGLTPERAARRIAVQIAVGRDTFLELCKVRALRTCWQKVLTAAGVPDAARARPRRLLVADAQRARSLGQHAARHDAGLLGRPRRRRPRDADDVRPVAR